MQDMKKFFRANPQALVLLVICVLLGFGAFLAVMIGLLTAGSSTTTGEPSGVIAALNHLG
jgi:predicted benzoate:H+ symporter BenE